MKDLILIHLYQKKFGDLGLEISVLVSDSKSGVKNVEIYLDDKRMISEKISSDGEESKWASSAQNVEIGIHNWKVIAVDMLGNYTSEILETTTRKYYWDVYEIKRETRYRTTVENLPKRWVTSFQNYGGMTDYRFDDITGEFTLFGSHIDYGNTTRYQLINGELKGYYGKPEKDGAGYLTESTIKAEPYELESKGDKIIETVYSLYPDSYPKDGIKENFYYVRKN